MNSEIDNPSPPVPETYAATLSEKEPIVQIASFEIVLAMIDKINSIPRSPIDFVDRRSWLSKLQHYAEHPNECEPRVAEYIRHWQRDWLQS